MSSEQHCTTRVVHKLVVQAFIFIVGQLLVDLIKTLRSWYA